MLRERIIGLYSRNICDIVAVYQPLISTLNVYKLRLDRDSIVAKRTCLYEKRELRDGFIQRSVYLIIFDCVDQLDDYFI